MTRKLISFSLCERNIDFQKCPKSWNISKEVLSNKTTFVRLKGRGTNKIALRLELLLVSKDWMGYSQIREIDGKLYAGDKI